MDDDDLIPISKATRQPDPVDPVDPVDAWFKHWFPDEAVASHPVPYLSGQWHHIRDAYEDLKRRLADSK